MTSTTGLRETLEPCPLCGVTLEIRTGRNPYGRHPKDSECFLAAHAVNIPHDVERWNRRSSPNGSGEVSEAMVEAVVELVEERIAVVWARAGARDAFVAEVRSALFASMAGPETVSPDYSIDHHAYRVAHIPEPVAVPAPALPEAKPVADEGGHVWPVRLQLRDTKLHDDLGGGGQRIYTTAGRGYKTVEYVRADAAPPVQVEREAVIELNKHVAVFTVEEEHDIKLSVYGSIVAKWDEHSPEGIALLKLDAAIRSLSRTEP